MKKWIEPAIAELSIEETADGFWPSDKERSSWHVGAGAGAAAGSPWGSAGVAIGVGTDIPFTGTHASGNTQETKGAGDTPAVDNVIDNLS